MAEDSARSGHGARILVALAVAAAAVMVLVPPIAQPAGYHHFADDRERLGIPHAWNVLSNAPFLVVGLLGLARLRRGAGPRHWEARAAAVLFGAVALVAIGSAYYHLRPDDDRLVWDRLPIAVAFMALLALEIGRRVDRDLGRRLFWFLVAAGATSAVTWRYTHDLRPYGVVQYGAAFAIVLLAWRCPSRAPRAGWIWRALVLYGLAKVCEASLVDHAIAAATAHWLSGHTLKHLFAAGATGVLVGMFAGGPGDGTDRH